MVSYMEERADHQGDQLFPLNHEYLFLMHEPHRYRQTNVSKQIGRIPIWLHH